MVAIDAGVAGDERQQRLCPATNWMWLAGRKWLSVSWSVRRRAGVVQDHADGTALEDVEAVGDAPAGLPRLQTTILPVNVPGAAAS